MKFSTLYLTAIALASSGTASALPGTLDPEVATSEADTSGAAPSCLEGAHYCGWELVQFGKHCRNVS